MGGTKDFLDEEVRPGTHVIDLGCGAGFWSRHARALGAEVVGVDHNESDIKTAKQISPDIHFAASTVEDFMSKNQRVYDLAIITHLLEHLESPADLLRMIGSKVRKVIVEVPDVETDPINFARLTLGLPFYTDSDHVREYSSETLELLLKSQNYLITKVVRRGGSIAVIAISENF